MNTAPYTPAQPDLRTALANAYLDYLLTRGSDRHNPISPAYLDYVARVRATAGLQQCASRRPTGRIDVRCALPAGEDHDHRARIEGTHRVVTW